MGEVVLMDDNRRLRQEVTKLKKQVVLLETWSTLTRSVMSEEQIGKMCEKVDMMMEYLEGME